MRTKFVAAIMLLAGGIATAQVVPPTLQTPLAPSAIPQFVQPLPVLGTAWAQSEWRDSDAGGHYPRIPVVGGNGEIDISVCEFQTQMLPTGTPLAATAPGGAGAAGFTWNWGYVVGSSCAVSPDTYIGPVIVNARNGGPTTITFANKLGNSASSNVTFWERSTDQTLHWADPLFGEENMCVHHAMPGMFPEDMGEEGPDCRANYSGPIPMVPHLHGGEVPPELDGGPDAWVTSDGRRGHGYYTKGIQLSEPLPSPATHALGTVGFTRHAGVEDGTPTREVEWYQVVQATDPDTGVPSKKWVPYIDNTITYAYPNTQEAAPIWFHDHSLGATRLNVYAGIAGGYYVVEQGVPRTYDPSDPTTVGRGVPSVDRVVPLVIQDRQFDTNGQLFFQAGAAGNMLWALNPDHPYWSPEFVGDTIVVNGKAWPYLNVQPKRYRFLVLNGSNARTYELFLTNPVTKADGPPLWVIANDGGYLDRPQKIDPLAAKPAPTRLVVMPGERYEIIVDFSKLTPGTTLVMKNTARTPYPGGATPGGTTTGRVMQFRVVACRAPEGGVAECGANDPTYDPTTNASLRDRPMVQLVSQGNLAAGVTATKTRRLTLNEVMGMPMFPYNVDPVTGVPYPGGPLEVLVNNTKWSGESPRPKDSNDFTTITVNGITTAFSEIPREGETEVWEIINLTADAHPIHLHLAQFQVLQRRKLDVAKYNAVYDAAFPAASCNNYVQGTYCPGYGPPLPYGATDAAVVGGNPDPTKFVANAVLLPAPQETGWKDTVLVPPGQVTKIAVRWSPTDIAVDAPAEDRFYPFDPSADWNYGYVWHCHIIDHEDNEMMRPDLIDLNTAAPPPALRPIRLGTHY